MSVPFPDPAGARTRLMEGYTRFVTGRPDDAHRSQERLREVAAAPAPFAVILGCADARVPPEVIFDQGFGDLFVVRVAGAVVTDVTLASIEIAAREMRVPLVVALGHTRCRALQACIDVVAGRQQRSGSIDSLVAAFAPAIEAMRNEGTDAIGRAAVRLTAERLRAAEPVLAPAQRERRLEIAGWLYDVDSGIIEQLT